jgi:radical SAM protein with 4Fe4S-binding SPASM domain
MANSRVEQGLLRLSQDCSLKLLEEPCVYNRVTDELYVINHKALNFLSRCVQGAPYPEDTEAASFVDYCLGESILVTAAQAKEPVTRTVSPLQSPVPSLRYLLLHITDRCNLKCRHCFLGEAGKHELALAQVKKVIDEFETMQGLRLMVSGGEPLLHQDFFQINDYLEDKKVRRVLLTNGTLLTEAMISRLKFDEVQISLDGMQEAHDRLRGAGSFKRALAALELLAAAGIQVSVATMIHRYNLGDFDVLEDLLTQIGVREWSVDLPALTGRLAAEPGLLVDAKTAAVFLSRSFGGAIHEPAPGYACGAHLMAIMADGRVARCGFYAHQPIGNIEEGLARCWQKVPKVLLDDLKCDCEFLNECRGGCRFRASGYNIKNGPDLCQCYRYGVRISS